MPQTILCVDSDSAARLGRKEALDQAGFEVIEAVSGSDAVRLARERRPTLVVLAVEPEGSDGFATCRLLKADPRTAWIPVLHISSRSGGYPESLRSGAQAYLQAPVEPQTLIAVAEGIIDAHKTAEEERQRLAGDLAAILDAVPVAIWIAHDPECQRITGNAYADSIVMRAERGGNVSASARHGDEAVSYLAFRDGVELRPEELPNQVAAATGQPVRQQEFELVFPDGRTVHLLLSAVPLFDSEGRVRGSVAAGVDVARRKRAEAALRESEAVLRSFFDSAGVLRGIVELIDGGIVHVSSNTAAAEMFGLDQNSVGGKSAAEAGASEEVARRWVDLYEHSRRTGQPVSMEYARRGADGRERWLMATANFLGAGPSGNPRFGYTVLDLTDRKRTEEALRENEAALRGFFDSPGVMRGFVDLVDGEIVHVSCNSAAAEMYGVDRDSIAGRTASEVGASEEIKRPWVALYKESQRTGKPVSMEYARRVAGQKDRWLLATAGYVGIGRAGHPRFAYTILDLTDRKRVEEALRESEERFRTMADGCPTIILVTDAEGENRFVNRTYREFFGVTNEQAEGSKWRPLLHPDDAAAYVAALSRAVRERAPFQAEARARRADGAWRWIAAYGEPRFAPGGEFLGHAGICSDITERKQAEEALRASESQLRTLGDNLPEGAIYRYRIAADGAPHVDFISAGIERLTGIPAAEFMRDGGTVERNVLPEDLARLREAIALSRERLSRFEVEVRHKHRETGELHWSLMRSTPSRCPDGSTAWDGIELDITERKRMEESLRESESRERARAAEVEALMEAAPAAIFISHDAECRSMSGNRAAYSLLRRQRGKNLSKSAPEGEGPANFRAMKDGAEIPPEALPAQKAASTGQPVRDYELDVVFEDGAVLNLVGNAVPLLDDDGRPRGSVGVLSDVTELKRAEARLRESQKLESLGLLAGGVAHDFNNLLVGVIGNASLAQEILPRDHPAAELLDGVLRTGEQAAHLTRQMLAYSGKGKFLVEALDLSALIPEISGLVRPSIPKKIGLVLDLAEDLPPIQADRGQVQQVFMNLALNAAEAIGSHEGAITVRTGAEDVDDRYLRLNPEAAALRPGRHVFLEVRDTGCGMDEATRTRIFDPFFSTKFTGRGLGLAAVAGILRGHKGAITVRSAPGKGSCFTVLFPAGDQAAEKPQSSARSVVVQGAGTVLVVDDEQLVREMARRSLERRGYTVLLADSGLAAIDVCKRHPSDIALVVLDLSMPQMSGEEALPEIRKLRPAVKVVVSSGYSEAEAMTLFKGQRVSGFIQKPYTSMGLAEKVKLCLASPLR